MIKLKEVIQQLNDSNYLLIENKLIKTKADNFLFLLKAYREKSFSDKNIINELDITPNSFYVLKSRLFEKIQNCLSSNLFDDQEKTLKSLLQVPSLCYNTPRETAIAYLLKLEKDLQKLDMHHELLIVYSALKKMHLHSQKYYQYSKLYNKQVSYSLSVEKAEEVLGNFCRLLSLYDLSKSTETYKQLSFLKLEMDAIRTFCNSMQTQLIKTVIELQLLLFCQPIKKHHADIEQLINKAKKCIDEIPLTLIYKKWEIVLDYFCFEYYYSVGSNKLANEYFNKINNSTAHLLLYNHVGLVSKFLTTKIKFCAELKKTEKELAVFIFDKTIYDSFDAYTQMKLYLHNAMVCLYQKRYEKAIDTLNYLSDNFVFVDFFYEYLNIKLTLVHLYIISEEFVRAKKLLKTLYRRVKMENEQGYKNVYYLLNVFDLEIKKQVSSKKNIAQQQMYALFKANNTNNNPLQIATHLMPALKAKYYILDKAS
jgi:hypothetical protein